MKVLVVFLFATMAVAQNPCGKGEYRSVDGGCSPEIDSAHLVPPSNPDDPPFKDELYTLSGDTVGYKTVVRMFADKANVEILPMAPTDDSGKPRFSLSDMLIRVTDAKGVVIMTAYLDGHVVASDPTKIDAAAKEFWMAMAQYMWMVCKEKP